MCWIVSDSFIIIIIIIIIVYDDVWVPSMEQRTTIHIWFSTTYHEYAEGWNSYIAQKQIAVSAQV